MRARQISDPVPVRAGFFAALGAVLTPLVVLTVLNPGHLGAHVAVTATGLVSYTAVLFATLLLYLYWRTSAEPIGWLVTALTLLTVQALAMQARMTVDGASSDSHLGWIVMTQALIAVGVGVLVLISSRRPLLVDPLLAGVTIGLVVVTFRYSLISTTEPQQHMPTTTAALRVLLLMIDLVIAVELVKLTVAPGWVRVRLAYALGLLSIGHAAAYPASDSNLLNVMTIAANILGASVLLALAMTLLRISTFNKTEELRLANVKLEQVEADVRDDAARLHEIRATLAGLTSASQLIHQGDAIAEDRRRQIEEMMDSEMSRLQRLLHDDTAATPQSVDLDRIIEPLVLRHQLRGFPFNGAPLGSGSRRSATTSRK